MISARTLLYRYIICSQIVSYSDMSVVRLSCIAIIYVQTILYGYPNPLVYPYLRQVVLNIDTIILTLLSIDELSYI